MIHFLLFTLFFSQCVFARVLPNRTPDQDLRNFSSDRPGSTNTPSTIDPGHYQFEIEAFNFSQNQDSSTQLVYPNVRVRIGVLETFEIALSYATYLQQWSQGQTLQGGGDSTFSLKSNLYGDGKDNFALALMFTGKIPTDRSGVGNSYWDPSLMVPIVVKVKKWEASLMPEIDLRKNNSDDKSHVEFNAPFSFAWDITSNSDLYAEWVVHISQGQNKTTSSYFGIGGAWKVAASTQIDLGCNLGQDTLSPRYNPFLGISQRF